LSRIYCNWDRKDFFTATVKKIKLLSEIKNGEKMIQIDDFSKMLSGELEILQSQTAGLTQAESLLQP